MYRNAIGYNADIESFIFIGGETGKHIPTECFDEYNIKSKSLSTNCSQSFTVDNFQYYGQGYEQFGDIIYMIYGFNTHYMRIVSYNIKTNDYNGDYSQVYYNSMLSPINGCITSNKNATNFIIYVYGDICGVESFKYYMKNNDTWILVNKESKLNRCGCACEFSNINHKLFVIGDYIIILVIIEWEQIQLKR